MPANKRTPDERPKIGYVLAAIDRAERHQYKSGGGVSLATIKAHLGIRHTGWTTRLIRPPLEELASAGLLAQVKRNGVTRWSLTDKGREHATQPDNRCPLPEAPQHRTWREAHAAAERYLPELRAELRDVLTAVIKLLDAEHQIISRDWLDASESLQMTCRNVASATYCLYEWAEPDDATADIDKSRDHGRRETRWAQRG